MASASRSTFVATTIYGLVALVPIALVGLSSSRSGVLSQVAKPLALESRFLAALVLVGGVAGLAVICFLLGTLVRTRLGASAYGTMETRYSSACRATEPIVSILRGFAQKSDGYRPALVTLSGPGAAVFALVMEENPDGSLTIFVPSAPAMAVGTVHVVARDRVALLDASVSDLSGCISQWGGVSRKLLTAAAAKNP
jgi:uncharacterized membrane protein